jgi:hypothetical protein
VCVTNAAAQQEKKTQEKKTQEKNRKEAKNLSNKFFAKNDFYF